MQDVLLRFLREEQVSSILKVVSCSWRELTCMEVFYTKQGQYCVARSFCTDTWISGNPLGNPGYLDGYLSLTCLEDVATVFCYATVDSWKKHQCYSERQIQMIYSVLGTYARSIAENVLGDDADKISTVRFAFTPTPVIIVSLVSKSVFLGALSITLTGHAQTLTATASCVRNIVANINVKPKSMYKEIAYACEHNADC